MAYQCPQCGNSFSAPGGLVRCARCGNFVTIVPADGEPRDPTAAPSEESATGIHFTSRVRPLGLHTNVLLWIRSSLLIGIVICLFPSPKMWPAYRPIIVAIVAVPVAHAFLTAALAVWTVAVAWAAHLLYDTSQACRDTSALRTWTLKVLSAVVVLAGLALAAYGIALESSVRWVFAVNRLSQGFEHVAASEEGLLLRGRHEKSSLVWLRLLDNLQSLTIADSPLSPEEVSMLRQIRTLEQIGLQNVGLEEAAIAHLNDWTALQTLGLFKGSSVDRGLSQLHGLPNLRSLQVAYSDFSDTGACLLAHCPSLEILDLSYTRVTDKGIPELRTLPKLGTLKLVGTNVSNRSTSRLSELRQLQNLLLPDTAFTDQDVENLRKALPHCRVDSQRW